MPPNTSPIFGEVGVIGMASIATANTALDGTGTLGTLLTGATDGTRVDFVVVKSTVTTTAGMVRMFIDDGGGNIYLWDELDVTALTPSATVRSFRGIIQCGFILPSGYIIKMSTHNAETFRCFAHGATY